ncbi:hypothetical protein [Francisella tularensis]|nr:hypothetical protein [Francisella tularensis]
MNILLDSTTSIKLETQEDIEIGNILLLYINLKKKLISYKIGVM